MNAICLITFRPRKVWCDFLNEFTKYKVFMIVDDDIPLHPLKQTYTRITFVQLQHKTCKEYGYMNTNFVIRKLISGWDKALFYFGTRQSYEFVWFIEDDVFFYNEDTILCIDAQYKSDVLSNQYETNLNGHTQSWLWKYIVLQYSPPYYHGMMCAVRFSKKMLKCIHQYATQHKTLCFLEALFPTVALKNRLIYHTPIELNQIHHRQEFSQETMNVYTLYHPIKDMSRHTHLRQTLGKIK